MGNINATTIITVLFFFVMFIGGLSLVGTELLSKNPNLDDTSIAIITDIETGTDTYNKNTLALTGSNITSNSTFEGVDPFVRQYLEDKSGSLEQKTIFNKILTAPDFLWKIIGIETPAIITLFSGILYAFLVLLIVLAAFKFIKGDV